MMQPLYFVETTFRNVRGRAFIECDRDTNSRAYIIGLIRTGEVNPVTILEIDEEGGSCTDVTEDVLAEALKANFIALGEMLFSDQIEHDRDHARDDRGQERV